MRGRRILRTSPVSGSRKSSPCGRMPATHYLATFSLRPPNMIEPALERRGAVSQPKEATMIRRLEESSDNVLGWEVTGKVTEEEVRTLSEEFKAAIAEHGKVRVLVRMRRIPRMGLGAWVEDFKLTPYAKDVERYAIVSDSNLFEWTSKIAEAFIGGGGGGVGGSRYEGGGGGGRACSRKTARGV